MTRQLLLQKSALNYCEVIYYYIVVGVVLTIYKGCGFFPQTYFEKVGTYI